MEALAYMHSYAAYEEAMGIEYELPQLRLWRRLPSSAWLGLLGVAMILSILNAPELASAARRVSTPSGRCLNARYGPSTRYGVYTCVRNGATLKPVVRRRGSWLQLSSGRWVYEPYTRIISDTGGGGNSATSFSVRVSTNGSRLRVRSGPSTSYPVTYSLANGSVVRAGRNQSGWTPLRAGGWVSSQWVIPVGGNGSDDNSNSDTVRRRELQRRFENQFVNQGTGIVFRQLRQQGYNPTDNGQGQIAFRADSGAYQVTLNYSTLDYTVRSVRVT